MVVFLEVASSGIHADADSLKNAHIAATLAERNI